MTKQQLPMLLWKRRWVLRPKKMKQQTRPFRNDRISLLFVLMVTVATAVQKIAQIRVVAYVASCMVGILVHDTMLRDFHTLKFMVNSNNKPYKIRIMINDMK